MMTMEHKARILAQDPNFKPAMLHGYTMGEMPHYPEGVEMQMVKTVGTAAARDSAKSFLMYVWASGSRVEATDGYRMYRHRSDLARNYYTVDGFPAGDKGKFPDTDRIFPRSFVTESTHTLAELKAWIKALKEALALHKATVRELRGVKRFPIDTLVVVHIPRHDSESAYISSVVLGEHVRTHILDLPPMPALAGIGFNPDYLIETLAYFVKMGAADVTIGSNSEVQPVVFKSGNGWTDALLMPVKP